MPNPITTPDLAARISPFVNAKLNRQRDPASKYGGYLPLRSAIDIHHRSVSLRADVRSVGPEGVEVFFYRGCDMIRWADIRKVVIHGLDADGDYTSETEFVHVGQRVKVAA